MQERGNGFLRVFLEIDFSMVVSEGERGILLPRNCMGRYILLDLLGQVFSFGHVYYFL